MNFPRLYNSARFIAILVLLFSVFVGKTQSNDTIKIKDEKDELNQDSPILINLDSLINIKYFSKKILTEDGVDLNLYDFETDFVPTYSDSIYEARIQFLNAQTPIELTYNKHVKNYIKLYGERKRDLTQRLLGLSKVYFPLLRNNWIALICHSN